MRRPDPAAGMSKYTACVQSSHDDETYNVKLQNPLQNSYKPAPSKEVF
jgi:hypothetical protein